MGEEEYNKIDKEIVKNEKGFITSDAEIDWLVKQKVMMRYENPLLTPAILFDLELGKPDFTRYFEACKRLKDYLWLFNIKLKGKGVIYKKPEIKPDDIPF